MKSSTASSRQANDEAMKQPVPIDLRNVYRPDEMAQMGFVYDSIGRARAGE
jgi:hypothetical protein